MYNILEQTTVIICQESGVASLKIELLLVVSNYLLMIIRDYVGWSLTRNRKQKNMSNFWPKKWSRSLKKIEWWLRTRELLKQYLTEKQNGCLRSGRLREVVAMRELTVSPENNMTL